MTKEYMVKMKLRNGNWCIAHRPNITGVKRTYRSVEEARAFMYECSNAWDVYIEKCEGIGHRLRQECLPADWRVVSREVSEWKAE